MARTYERTLLNVTRPDPIGYLFLSVSMPESKGLLYLGILKIIYYPWNFKYKVLNLFEDVELIYKKVSKLEASKVRCMFYCDIKINTVDFL